MIQVAELMTENVITLSSTESLTAARKLMSEHNIRHIPIVDDGQLAGVISQRDVLAMEESPLMAGSTEQRFQREQEIRIADCLRDKVVSIESAASALSAARYLQKHKLGCLPVVDEGKLVGIITDSDYINVAINLMEINELHESEF